MRFYKVIALVAAMPACSSLQLLIDQNTSKIEIELINGTPGVPLAVALFDSSYDCTGQTLVAFESAEKIAAKRFVFARSHQTLNYKFMGIGISGGQLAPITCSGTSTFPTPNLVSYKIRLSRFIDGCGVEIAESGTDKWSAAGIVQRQYWRPKFESGPWCVADERYR
jgi:hypothetical protein